MQNGNLRYKLTVQAPKRGSDGRGGFTNDFNQPTTVSTIWGEVKALNTRDRLMVQQEKTTLTHRITVHFKSGRGINATMRLAYNPSAGDTRYLYVQGIPYDPDGRRQWLVIECEERSE